MAAAGMATTMMFLRGARRWQSSLSESTVLRETRRYEAEDLSRFAALTGDHNAIHAVATPPFEAPIVHGMLLASAFPALFAKHHPGAVYRDQTLSRYGGARARRLRRRDFYFLSLEPFSCAPQVSRGGASARARRGSDRRPVCAVVQEARGFCRVRHDHCPRGGRGRPRGRRRVRGRDGATVGAPRAVARGRGARDT